MPRTMRAQVSPKCISLVTWAALAASPGCLPAKQICIGDCQASETFATGDPSEALDTTVGSSHSSSTTGMGTNNSGSTSGGSDTDAEPSTGTDSSGGVHGSEGPGDADTGSSSGSSTGGESLGHTVEMIDPNCTEDCPPSKTLAWSRSFEGSSNYGHMALARPDNADGIHFYVATSQDRIVADRNSLWVLALDASGHLVKDYRREAPGGSGVHVYDLTVAADGSVWGAGIFGFPGDPEYDPLEWLFHLTPGLDLVSVEENPPLAGTGTSITATRDGFYLCSNGVNQDRLIALGSDGRNVLWNKEVDFWTNGLIHSNDGHIYVVGRGDALRPTIVKFTTIGIEVWRREFDEIDNGEWDDVALTSDGRVVVSGTDFSGKAGEQDILLAVFHADGTPHWSRALDSSGWDIGMAVTVGPTNEILVAGTIRPEGERDLHAMLRAYDSRGEMRWTETFSEGQLKPSDVVYTTDGGVIVIGPVKQGPMGDATNHHLVRKYQP